MRMESLTMDPFHIRIIKIISDQRGTDGFHMNAYLVGTACFQIKGEEAVPIFFFHYLIMGDSRLPMFIVNGALNDGTGFASERGIDGAGVRKKAAPDNGQILTVYMLVHDHGC